MVSKSPFSLYDFLGYFIPGALMIYLIALIFQINPIVWLDRKLLNDLHMFEKTFSFVILSYILGHCISYLSSVTIERYSIWSIGYPSKYILGQNKNCYFKKWIETNEKNTFKDRLKEYIISFFWRLALLIFILPMFVFDFGIGIVLSFRRFYTNSVDDTLKDIILKKMKIFRNTYKYLSSKKGDYYRIIYHYVYEKFEAHRVKFDNYVALYGFTRAISLVMCVYSWILLYVIIKEKFFSFEWSNSFMIAFILSSLMSYIFYLAFVKFYRRYTLEGFMCLVIDPEFK